MPFNWLPRVSKCCVCVGDLKTATAIIAVLAIVTSPAVSWAAIRHAYVIRVSCLITSTVLRPDVVDVNLNNILSFGFGANAGIGPTCLSSNITNIVKDQVFRTTSSAASNSFVKGVRWFGWVVLLADLIVIAASINLIVRLYRDMKPPPVSRIPEGGSTPDRSGGDNSSTPIRPPTPFKDSNDDEEDPLAARNETLGINYSNENLTTLKADIIAEMKVELARSMQEQMKVVLTPIKDHIREMQNSLVVLTDKYEEFNGNIEKLVNENKRHGQLLQSNRDAIDKLAEKINVFEQKMRALNIEMNSGKKPPDKKATKIFMFTMLVAIFLTFIYSMLYVIVCLCQGGAFPIFEFIFSLVDLGIWLYFIIVVNSYRRGGASGPT